MGKLSEASFFTPETFCKTFWLQKVLDKAFKYFANKLKTKTPLFLEGRGYVIEDISQNTCGKNLVPTLRRERLNVFLYLEQCQIILLRV